MFSEKLTEKKTGGLVEIFDKVEEQKSEANTTDC
jgi:hypothetical protein